MLYVCTLHTYITSVQHENTVAGNSLPPPSGSYKMRNVTMRNVQCKKWQCITCKTVKM